MRKSMTVKAVHDSDLQKLLQDIGLLDKLICGELICAFCGYSVDLDNLGTIFPYDDDIKVTCDSSKCVWEITNRRSAIVDE